MSDVFSLLEQEVDASKFDTINKDATSRLSDLIRRSIQLDKDIEDAEEHLKNLKRMKKMVSTEDIPGLMDEIWAFSLGIRPQGWDLGLEAGV